MLITDPFSVPAAAARARPVATGCGALAVHRTKLTAWQLSAGSTSWRTTQVITVPIQFGSSN
jgi:hypothetical protein